jgi:hypothetical protein
MSSLKTRLAGKAAKTTAKHGVRGAASKLRRDPLRTGTLFGVGCGVGILVGRFLARPGAATG